MIATTKSLLRSIAPLLALVALAAGSPAVAAAKSGHCVRHGTLLATHSGALLYHSDGALYGCVVVNGRAFTTRDGKWVMGSSKFVFDGNEVAWTNPLTVVGHRTDRLYAEDLTDGKRWLAGTRLVPQGVGAPFKDGRIERMMIFGDSVAWVTTRSDVVLAMRDPADPPVAVGTLPAPLAPVKQLLLIGSFPHVAATSLAPTLRLFDTDGGDGDECGGVDEFEVTVQPSTVADAIGAKWTTSWENDTDPACT